MNIVIYGCDNAGKTHLAKALEKALGGTQVHSLGNVPIEKQLDFMANELLPTTFKEVKIFDRFPIIEEEVYGNLLRGGSKYDSYDYDVKDYFLDKVNLFIYCYPGLLSTLNWQDREQMDGVKENVADIISEYIKLTYKLLKENKPILEFNYNVDPDYKEIIKKVLEIKHEYYGD